MEKIVKGKIANALTSVATNHIVATTDDLFDIDFQKYQNQINKDVANGVELLKKQINALSAGTVTEITKINNNIKDLSKKVADNTAAINKTHGELVALSASTVNIKGQVETNKQNINALSASTVNIKGQVESNKQNITSLSASTVNIKGQVETNKSNIISLSASTTTIKNDLTNLTKKVDTKQDKLVSGVNIKTINGQTILGSGNIVVSSGVTYTEGNGIKISTDHKISVDTNVVATKTDISTLDTKINTKQDKLTAGTNVKIENNVISATDTKYTAGEGISISSDNVITNTKESGVWGKIKGTLSDQKDLQGELDKLNSGITTTHGEVVSLSASTVEIKNTVNQLNTRVTTAEQNITNLSGATVILSQSAVTIDNKVNTLSAGTVNEVERLDNKIDELSGNTQQEVAEIYETILELSGNTTHGLETLDTKINTLSANTQEALNNLDERVTDIENVIPDEASITNPLADKAYVSQSILTASSNFRGNWANWTAVPTDVTKYPKDYSGSTIPTKNDYLVVNDASDYPDEELYGVWRFKYSGPWETQGKNGWHPEYQVNEEPQVIVTFNLNTEDYANPVYLCQSKVNKYFTLTDYPDLSEEDFFEFGFWDTKTTEMRDITEDVTISYLTPVITRLNNPELLDLAYSNGWCENYSYMRLYEVGAIDDEEWFKVANKIQYVSDSDGNLIEVTGDLYLQSDGTKLESYNCWDETGRTEAGDQYDIWDCYAVDSEGNKYIFSDGYNPGNGFSNLSHFEEFKYFSGVTTLSDFTNNNGNYQTFYGDYCQPKLISIVLPNSITEIGESAFYNCINLSSITMTDNITSIGESAFGICDKLTEITIPNSVTTIGNYAFNDCDNLIEVTLSNNITSINNGTFQSCGNLTGITIPDSVTSIGQYAFSYCTSLTGITIPNNVTTISANAFWNCSLLTSINIPNNVTSIGTGVLAYCTSLTSITVDTGNTTYDSRNNCNAIIRKSDNTLIAGCKNTVVPTDVIKIGHSAFYGCSGLTGITIPNNVTSIEDSAFYGCSGLTGITIPNNVTTIGRETFSSCTSISAITIPTSVTSISGSAFSNCDNLSNIEILNTTPFTIATYAFGFVRSNMLIVVPDDSLQTYRNTTNWMYYRSYIYGHEHTITFNADGGTPAPASQVVRYDKRITKPTDPYKEGYIFDGWVDKDNNPWDFSTGTTKEDITLKATYFIPALMSYTTSDSNPITPNSTIFGEGTFVDNVTK